jgi:hypothetical protein
MVFQVNRPIVLNWVMAIHNEYSYEMLYEIHYPDSEFFWWVLALFSSLNWFSGHASVNEDA